MGSGGHVVERWTFGRGDQGSKLPAAILKLGQFRSCHIAYAFRKKAVGPFDLVSMPGEVKGKAGK